MKEQSGGWGFLFCSVPLPSNMEKGYDFPIDSSAKILTSGLLGEQYIGLEAGGEDKNLVGGSVIRYTQSAIVLETLISKFLFSSADKQGAGATAATPAASAPPPLPRDGKNQ